MKKGEIHSGMSFMPNKQPPECTKPRKRTLNNPSVTIPPKRPTILGRRSDTISPVRANEFYLSSRQMAPQLVGIVSLVRNDSGRLLSGTSWTVPGDRNSFKQVVDQVHLLWCRGGNGHSQRNTLAVDQNHALRTFPPLGTADCVAPFFAGKNEASINTFPHFSFCLSSSSERKARQTSSQVSSSSHWLRRRQQVDGLGYSGGRSLHRAPVFRTQRIPSMTSRLPIRGRPAPRFFGSFARTGSIWDHCLSVKRMRSLAIRNTSEQRHTTVLVHVQPRLVQDLRAIHEF